MSAELSTQRAHWPKTVFNPFGPVVYNAGVDTDKPGVGRIAGIDITRPKIIERRYASNFITFLPFKQDGQLIPGRQTPITDVGTIGQFIQTVGQIPHGGQGFGPSFSAKSFDIFDADQPMFAISKGAVAIVHKPCLCLGRGLRGRHG